MLSTPSRKYALVYSSAKGDEFEVTSGPQQGHVGAQEPIT